MPPRLLRWAWLSVMGAALIARLVAMAMHPSPHPDAFFQYLEPAWWHLKGYGWPAWEWAVGLRSWVLPAYHGAWITLLSWLRVTDPTTVLLVLQAQWALFSVTMVAAAWRAGCHFAAKDGEPHAAAGFPGGLFAGLLAAGFAPLLYFSSHTLTEVPSTILATWGYVFWLDARTDQGARGRRAAALAGALLSAAVCLRIPNGPLAVIPALDLLLRRRFRLFLLLLAGALAPVLFFGAVDWVTWGKPFHSAREYINYNFIQGRAAEHGVSPKDEYVKQIVARLGVGLILLLVPILIRIRRVWPWCVPAVLLLAILSTQAHKEERFLLAIWPLLLGAAGGAMGSIVARYDGTRARAVSYILGAAATATILVTAAIGIKRMEPLDYTARWGLYEGQAWAGRQADATGVLVEGRFHLSGGWMMLGRNLPLDSFRADLLDQPLFNYAIVPESTGFDAMCRQHGFTPQWSRGGFAVYRRQPAL